MDTQLQYIGNEDAIEMAIHSGELLYQQKDVIHDWALTLIISNLFELVAQEAEPGERFERGFRMVMGNASERELPFGWQARYVAEAIRNMFDHGMTLDRKQTRSYQNNDKVEVISLGFIPRPKDNEDDLSVFDIEELGVNQFGLMVSPVLYWKYVQEWNERRTAT